MKKRYGAIVWHVHQDTEDRFLALEKRACHKAYQGIAYITFITGPNFANLCDDDVERMREYARSNGIALTTNKVTVRYV